LQVNLKDAVKKYLETIKNAEKAEELQNKLLSFNFFNETFEDKWSFNWSGIYKSFFVEAHGITSGDVSDLVENPFSSNSLREYQSYLTSTWNA
jgi:hypothetical protein